MSRRLLITVAALAAAATLLIATAILSPPAATRSTGPTLDPRRLPSHLDPADPRSLQAQRIEGGYYYDFRNERGQLIQVLGASVTPRQGMSLLTQPLVRMHLTDSRIFEMRADECMLDALDNHLRSGTFRSNVVLTLYDAADANRPVRLDAASPDVNMRVYLDEAYFDLELGEIRSPGPVRLDSPRALFEGTGLQLAYNQKHSRIERIEIVRGKRLSIKSDLRQPPRDSGNPPAPSSSPASPASQPDPQRETYYRAAFSDNLHVQHPQLELRGDVMTLLFSLGGNRQRDQLATQIDSAATQPLEPLAPPGPPAVVAAHDLPTLFHPAPDDLQVAWTGLLTVIPESQKPSELAGPGDVKVAVTGRPVMLNSNDGLTAVCSAADYIESTGRIRLIGNELSPLTALSQRMGKLTGRELAIAHDGKGHVLGPGTFTAPDAPAPASRLPDAAGASPLPPGMNIAWTDRVDIEFFTAAPGDALDAADATGLKGLKAAAFAGNVKVRHPDMDLRSDKLALALTPPADPASKESATLERIDARGNVAVTLAPRDPAQRMDMVSDALQVHMARDAGKSGRLLPRRIVADGDVEGRQVGQTMNADHLEALLAPLAPADANALVPPAAVPASVLAADAPAAGHPSMTLTQLDLRGHVRIRQDKPDTRIDADAVHYTQARNEARILGSAADPARVERDGGTLTAATIVLDELRHTLSVDGPGRFDFAESTAPRNDGMPRNDKPQQVSITWARAMTFNTDTHQARFLGDVRTHSKAGLETNTLTCADLQASFAAKTPAANALPPRPGANTEAGLDPGLRQLRQIDAAGDVVFLSESWLDKLGGQVATRMRLAGNKLTFTSDPQQVLVDDIGSLLLEDYRPAAKPSDNKIAFTGRGATLFTWRRTFRLDVQRSDMLMLGKVQMTHRPAGGGEPLLMDCNQLLADMESASALAPSLAGSARRLDVKAVLANDDVTLRLGPRGFRADRLTYSGVDRSAVLNANEGKNVEMINSATDPTIFTAQRVRWNLKDDTLEITRPGPVRQPLSR